MIEKDQVISSFSELTVWGGQGQRRARASVLGHNKTQQCCLGKLLLTFPFPPSLYSRQRMMPEGLSFTNKSIKLQTLDLPILVIELKNSTRYKGLTMAFICICGKEGLVGLAACTILTAPVWLSAPGNVCLQSRTWPMGKTDIVTALLSTISKNLKSH